MRSTQDDSRETSQVELFQLTHLPGRSNKYTPDATIEVGNNLYQVELKTSDVEKKMVSTSRLVTLSKLDEYRNLIWIFSQYKKLDKGFEFTGEHYFLYGKQLDPWLEKQRVRILLGSKTYAGLDDWYRCKKVIKGLISEDTLERLDNTFTKHGCGLNDPRISWREVESFGTKIDITRPKEHIRELLEGDVSYALPKKNSKDSGQLDLYDNE
tara:strand:- start:1009 stop:1641 length:633 start_codon:yes stop_codon:yes gene_type:complete